MSSSQTSLWINRGNNFLTIQLLISPLEPGGKEQVPPLYRDLTWTKAIFSGFPPPPFSSSH